MKKTLFLLLSFVAVTAGNAQETDLSTMTDAVYVQSQNVPAGSQQILSVCMKNSISVQTIQFDLYLPEGLSFVANEDDELMTASKARINKFNYFESSIQSDGALRLLAQASTTNIPVGDGEIATVIVNVDASMELGDYPVSVKNIILVSKENETKKADVVTTTITVTEKADTRTVLDENSTTAPESASNVDVRVLRTIKAGEWGTICLPFAMSAEQVKTAFGDDVQLGDFTGCETTQDEDENVVGLNVEFSTVAAIEANHPYIIKVSELVSEFTADGVDINAEEEPSVDMDELRLGSGTKKDPYRYLYNSFAGTYVAETVVPEKTLFLSGNKFLYSAGLTKMKAFRAYFDFYDVLTSVEEAGSRMHIVFNDNATGIRQVADAEGGSPCYNLQGLQVEKPSKGLYIMNGKKVVVK